MNQPPAPRRWLPRPQFSLRLLLLAVTAFAIAFPIWYRWPVEEITLEYPRISARLGSKSVQLEDKKSPPIRRTVTTWRRSWGKGKVKHGPKTVDLLDADQRIVTYYETDLRHGPYVYTIQGDVRESGQFARDKKAGEWKTFEKRSGMHANVKWREGQIHGDAGIHYPSGDVDRLRFASGILTQINEQPVTSALLNRSQQGEIRAANAVEELQQVGGSLLVKTTLSQWIGLQADMSPNVPLLLSPIVPDSDVPFDARTMGIDFQSGLVLISQRNGLDCDYRYGCLWITTPEDAKDWTDPTGVSSIRLRPGTPLAAAWNEPIKVWQFDEPLTKALDKLFVPLAIPIDASRVASTADSPNRFPVNLHLSINGNYLPLRDLLGLLLYKTGCRCKLSGDTLVILPPESATNQQ